MICDTSASGSEALNVSRGAKMDVPIPIESESHGSNRIRKRSHRKQSLIFRTVNQKNIQCLSPLGSRQELVEPGLLFTSRFMRFSHYL